MKANSIVTLLLVVSGMAAGAAYAISDACCDAPSCFCYQAENGDWKQGSYAYVPSNAQTKGLQFRVVGQADRNKKTQKSGSTASVKLPKTDMANKSAAKTKANCEAGGGVWAGEDGKGSCTGLRK